MRIGAKIRQLRKQQGLTQQDIEAKTGLMKCHLSVIENGHKVPALETVERIAAALNVPLCWLFYAGGAASAPSAPRRDHDTAVCLAEENMPPGRETRFLLKLRGVCGRMGDFERELFIMLAKRLATRTGTSITYHPLSPSELARVGRRNNGQSGLRTPG